LPAASFGRPSDSGLSSAATTSFFEISLPASMSSMI
jgi:hypothetical protein